MTVTTTYQGQLGTATGSGATLLITSATAPVGSLIVVFIAANINAGSVSGVTDSGGNTYFLHNSAVNAATYPNAALYWARVTNGTIGTITVAFNATVPTASAAAAHDYTASGAPAGWGWNDTYTGGNDTNTGTTTPSDFDQDIYAAGVKVSALAGQTTTATITNFNGSVPSGAGYVERSRTVASPITLWAIDNIGLTGVGVYAGPNMSATMNGQMLGGAFFYGPLEVQHAANNSTAGGVSPTLVVTMPTATLTSNVLVAMCASNGGTGFTAPGWTSVGITGGNRLITILWRVGDGNTAYTFTRTAGATGEGLDIAVWEFSGLDLTAPVDLAVRTDSTGAQASPANLVGGTAAINTLHLVWFVLDGNTTGQYLDAGHSWWQNWSVGGGGNPTQFTDPTGKVTVYQFGRFATVSAATAPVVANWTGSVIWTGAVVTLKGASTVTDLSRPMGRQFQHH